MIRVSCGAYWPSSAIAGNAINPAAATPANIV